MKKIILIASLIAISNTGFCQRNTMINTKDISPFSIGAMPIMFASENRGPGFGLELNTRYAASKNIGVSLFARMKSIMEEDSYYNEYGPSENTVVGRNVFAVGTALDYHLFRAVNLQLRAGYEVEADPQKREMKPRFIYGGGLLFKLSNSQNHKIGHSLRVGIDFESDRTIVADYPTVDLADFPYSQNFSTNSATINSFSLQVGWNFQFHSIKRGR
ncbi:MAG: hypothetical protein COB15_10035 [Flavobacteriales bacterium]|nr:MAG: hypothetical protein COB15_10035 [Flavobacteriales bacterium]